MRISIVVAVSQNNAIGKAGGLLWRLPKDMQIFKEITMGHHVIMGRKTYESITEKFRPLPGRVNVVITTQTNYSAPGCKVVNSLKAALQYATANDETEAMIIGGGDIYRQAMSYADRLYISQVQAEFPDADTFFPEIDHTHWKLVWEEKHTKDDKHSFDFTFQQFERIEM